MRLPDARTILKSVKSILRGGFDKLSSVHPLIYLMIYVISIPLFALVFERLQDEIYSPYVRMEKIGIDNDRALKILIEGDMKISVKGNKHNANFVAFINSDEIALREMDVDNEGRVYGILDVGYDNRRGSNFKRTAAFRLSESSYKMGDKTVIPATVLEDSPSPYNGTHVEPLDNVLHTVSIKEISDVSDDGSALLSAIYMTPRGLESLNYFKQGRRGAVVYTHKSSFARMLYFSVTTITTLGYGDMVPVSAKTRFAVALESVLGWLLAGLFLNAAAWRGGSRQQQPQRT